MTRTAPHASSRLWLAVGAIGLILCGSASAQTVGSAKVQSAYADWRRLAQSEVDCVDRALRAQNTSLWNLIQRGVDPSDQAAAKLRAACRSPATASRTPAGSNQTQALAAFAQNTATQKAAEKAAADKAAAEKAATEKATAEKAAAAKAAAEKAAAEKIAADKAAAEKLAAEKVAADKAAAEKAAAEKAAVAKVAAEKAAAEKAADEKRAADKAAAEKRAAEQAAAEKAEAERIAAEKTAAEQAAVEKAALEKAAADKAEAEKAALGLAIADTERVKAEAIQAKADAERDRQDAEKATAAAFAHAANESRISFVYGLILGLVFASLGGAVLLFMLRKKTAGAKPEAAAAPRDADSERKGEFDRLVTAMLTEQERRFTRHPAPAALPARDKPVDWTAFH